MLDIQACEAAVSLTLFITRQQNGGHLAFSVKVIINESSDLGIQNLVWGHLLHIYKFYIKYYFKAND
jgi:hypothetical protein